MFAAPSQDLRGSVRKGEQVASPIREALVARRHGGYLRKAFSEPSQGRAGCVAHQRGAGSKKACHLPSQDLLGAFARVSQGLRGSLRRRAGCVARRIGAGGKKAWRLPSQDLLGAFARVSQDLRGSVRKGEQVASPIGVVERAAPTFAAFTTSREQNMRFMIKITSYSEYREILSFMTPF